MIHYRAPPTGKQLPAGYKMFKILLIIPLQILKFQVYFELFHKK